MKAFKVDSTDSRIGFYCPGCDGSHSVPTSGPGAWGWNGSLSSPTFTPSLLVNADLSCPGAPRCHSFVRDGRIQFLADCSHGLAGETVDIPEDQ